MAHVVLAWELGAGFGHAVPLGLLARAFVEQGCRVTCVARDVTTATRLLAAPAVTVLPSPRIPAPARGFPLSINYSDNLWRNGYWHAEALAAAMSAWRGLLTSLQPDLLLVDHAPTALLASRDAEYPRAAIGMGFTLPPPLQPMPSVQPWLPIPPSRLLAADERLLVHVNSALTTHGLRRLAAVGELLDDVSAFVCAVPELDHYERRQQAEWLGPLVDDANTALPPDLTSALETSPVFVYLDCANRCHAEVLRALADCGRDAIVYLRDRDHAVAGSVRATNIHYLQTAVNLSGVAPLCSAAITQGGFGTVWSFLRVQRPMLICPYELEQSLLAYRLQQRGLARGLSIFSAQQRIAEQVADWLAKPLDSEPLRQLSVRYSHHRGSATAAEIAQRCLAAIGGSRGPFDCIPLNV